MVCQFFLKKSHRNLVSWKLLQSHENAYQFGFLIQNTLRRRGAVGFVQTVSPGMISHMYWITTVLIFLENNVKE